MKSVRIKAEIPKPVDHGTVIATELKKNKLIDTVKYFRSRYGFVPFECNYDEKKHGSVDKIKLENELKAAIKKLGYKTR